jgi:hypothetical protein
LKEVADDFDRRQPVQQQIDTLERYFQGAADVFESMVGTSIGDSRG